MKKSFVIIVVVLIYASITWWISFRSFGVYDIYEQGDAKIYAVNAASLSRTFESSPIHVLNPYTWDDFVNSKRALGIASALTNPGYSIIMAGIYKIAGKCRLWYGSMVSYFFYMLGIVFMILIFQRFLNYKEILFCCFLFCSSWLVIMNMIRPLTDPVFWGLSLFCIWFALEYPKKPIIIGTITGVILIFRIQAIFLYPLLLILIVQNFTFKDLYQATYKLSITAIPFFLILKIIPWFTGQNESALVINSDSTFYLTSYINFFRAFNFHDYIVKINQTIQKLSSLNVLTPVFWLLATSIFAHDPNNIVVRLRWFSFTGIVSLIIVACVGASPSSRLYLIFFPFIIALSFHFVKTLYNNSSQGAKKYITPFIVIFFLFSSSSGFLSIISGCTKSSSSPSVSSDAWESLEDHLSHFKPDAVIATNCLILPLFHETRNIVTLPKQTSSFIYESKRNKELDGIVFITYKNNLKHYSSWKQQLMQDNIIDSQNNKFIKSFELINPKIQIFCYKLKSS